MIKFTLIKAVAIGIRISMKLKCLLYINIIDYELYKKSNDIYHADECNKSKMKTMIILKEKYLYTTIIANHKADLLKLGYLYTYILYLSHMHDPINISKGTML